MVLRAKAFRANGGALAEHRLLGGREKSEDKGRKEFAVSCQVPIALRKKLAKVLEPAPFTAFSSGGPWTQIQPSDGDGRGPSFLCGGRCPGATPPAVLDTWPVQGLQPGGGGFGDEPSVHT